MLDSEVRYLGFSHLTFTQSKDFRDNLYYQQYNAMSNLDDKGHPISFSIFPPKSRLDFFNQMQIKPVMVTLDSALLFGITYLGISYIVIKQSKIFKSLASWRSKNVIHDWR